MTSRDAPAPLFEARADPFLLVYDGRFLFAATDDTQGRNVDSSSLSIRGAATLAGLRSAPDVPVLRAGEYGLAGSFWAPELHVVGGRLRCLFAPSVGERDWTHVHAYVMTLRQGGDPLRAADWHAPRPVLRREGSPLDSTPEETGISLDMTFFRDGHSSYLVWSQRTVAPIVGPAELWIARADDDRIDRLAGDPVRILSPSLDWQRAGAAVVEGPAVLRHGGRIHLTYSAGAVGPDYTMGLMTAATGSDLLDPAAWERRNEPLLATDAARGLWGPGHNSFLEIPPHLLRGRTSPVVLLHAMRAPDASERDTYLADLMWDDAGDPVIEVIDAVGVV